MEQISKKNISLFLIVFVIALEAILFSISNNNLDNAFLAEEKKINKIQNILDNASIQAKAVSIYDQTSNRKIYSKNDEVDMPIASIAKIMTVVTALNGYDMEKVISIQPEAIKQYGDYGMFVHEKFKIKDLAKITLVGSANDGAYALAQTEENFLQKMNDKAKKIGMEDTAFFNPTGLDVDDVFAGAYASAQDVNVMALFALRGYQEVFTASSLPEINIKSLSGFDHNIKNTDIILDKIPNILLSKTGYTPLAGGNLVLVYKSKNDHIIAVTVLGSTILGRFSDMEKLIGVLESML
jgi:D-alanyl-D-alanine carboxypeptidase